MKCVCVVIVNTIALVNTGFAKGIGLVRIIEFVCKLYPNSPSFWEFNCTFQ